MKQTGISKRPGKLMARSTTTTATRSSVHGAERTTTTTSSWSSTPLQRRPRAGAGAGRVDEYDYTNLLPPPTSPQPVRWNADKLNRESSSSCSAHLHHPRAMLHGYRSLRELCGTSLPKSRQLRGGGPLCCLPVLVLLGSVLLSPILYKILPLLQW